MVYGAIAATLMTHFPIVIGRKLLAHEPIARKQVQAF